MTEINHEPVNLLRPLSGGLRGLVLVPPGRGRTFYLRRFSLSVLRKVADLDLGGRKLALGRNGNYALVDESARDAWGNPTGRMVPVTEMANADSVQALLDALGVAIELLQAAKLERERRMGGGAE